jgi:3-dehydroquinate dehydratase
MDTRIDQMANEIDKLESENRQLRDTLDGVMFTLRSMAEGIAMVSHPNWLKVENKDEVIDNIVYEWMERSVDERYSAKRSQ